jgi:hypothetical protein
VGRHVATDFASTFLSAADLFSWIPTTWENRGLPLELTNALRFAPRGLFWAHAHDNDTLRRLQQLFGGVEPRADERTRRSRSILRAHCRSVFGPGNARLVSELGWATESFVAPVGDELVEPWDLRELDELWSPVASSGELDLLFRALETLVADGSPVAAHT